MTSITKSILTNSEPHVELDVSRENRGVSDLSKIQTWFREHNPFEGGPKLKSLTQGFAMMVQSIATTVRKLEKKFKNNLIISTSMMQRSNKPLSKEH